MIFIKDNYTASETVCIIFRYVYIVLIICIQTLLNRYLNIYMNSSIAAFVYYNVFEAKLSTFSLHNIKM
jgi:hypothetical protein